MLQKTIRKQQQKNQMHTAKKKNRTKCLSSMTWNDKVCEHYAHTSRVNQISSQCFETSYTQILKDSKCAYLTESHLCEKHNVATAFVIYVMTKHKIIHNCA